jgi:hypothetical protein
MDPEPPGAPTAAGWAVALTSQRALGAFTDVEEVVPQPLASRASAVKGSKARIEDPMANASKPA